MLTQLIESIWMEEWMWQSSGQQPSRSLSCEFIMCLADRAILRCKDRWFRQDGSHWKGDLSESGWEDLELCETCWDYSIVVHSLTMTAERNQCVVYLNLWCITFTLFNLGHHPRTRCVRSIVWRSSPTLQILRWRFWPRLLVASVVSPLSFKMKMARNKRLQMVP